MMIKIFVALKRLILIKKNVNDNDQVVLDNYDDEDINDNKKANVDEERIMMIILTIIR